MLETRDGDDPESSTASYEAVEMRLFCWVSRYMARNQTVSGSLLWAKTVPAVSEVW